MARRKIKILTHSCPRCGKTTAGLSRSIHGTESQRLKFKGICESCATPEEIQEILDGQGKNILKNHKP